jgi:hypothetical protein
LVGPGRLVALDVSEIPGRLLKRSALTLAGGVGSLLDRSVKHLIE